MLKRSDLCYFSLKTRIHFFMRSGQGILVRNAARNVSANSNIRNGDAYVVSKAALDMLVTLEYAEFGGRV